MLLLLASVLAVLFVLLGWGNLTNRLIKSPSNSLTFQIISGIVLLSTISSSVAFFIPLNFTYELFVVTIGVFGLLSNKNSLAYSTRFILKKKHLYLFVIPLFLGTFGPYIIDHFGYYVPTLEWLNQYGLVKGIANINLVLGQQSTWHLLQASFDNTIDPFLRLNVVLFLVFLLYCTERKYHGLLVFTPLFLLFIQSPSPDLPIYILTTIVVAELCNPLQETKTNLDLLWLISVYIFTVKPYAFCLPIFIILLYFKKKESTRLCMKSILITLVLLIPFLSRQLYCFGDFIFPIQSGLLTLDWKAPEYLLAYSKEMGIMKTYDMQYSMGTILSWSLSERIVYWFTLTGFKSIIHFFLAGIWFSSGAYFLLKQKKMMLPLWLIISLKLALIFWLTGQYRFMIDGILALATVFILQYGIKEKIGTILYLTGCVLLLIPFTFPILVQKNISSFYNANLMVPPQIKQIWKPIEYSISDYDKYHFNTISFYTPKNYFFMFDVPLPCMTPITLQEFWAAGVFPKPYNMENYGEGFYHEKITVQQRLELEKIYAKYIIPYPLEPDKK